MKVLTELAAKTVPVLDKYGLSLAGVGDMFGPELRLLVVVAPLAYVTYKTHKAYKAAELAARTVDAAPAAASPAGRTGARRDAGAGHRRATSTYGGVMADGSRNTAKIIAVMGASGSGKSAWIKQQLRAGNPARLLVWDPQEEFGAFGREVADPAELTKAVRRRVMAAIGSSTGPARRSARTATSSTCSAASRTCRAMRASSWTSSAT
jgi:hypothetical protein